MGVNRCLVPFESYSRHIRYMQKPVLDLVRPLENRIGPVLPLQPSDSSPCACFADGVAIATYASVGQRTLTIAPEKAPAGDAAVIVIRPRQGGSGFKYTVPLSALAKLGPMNKELNERERYDAVMAADGLFQVEPLP